MPRVRDPETGAKSNLEQLPAEGRRGMEAPTCPREGSALMEISS